MSESLPNSIQKIEIFKLPFGTRNWNNVKQVSGHTMLFVQSFLASFFNSTNL